MWETSSLCNIQSSEVLKRFFIYIFKLTNSPVLHHLSNAEQFDEDAIAQA